MVMPNCFQLTRKSDPQAGPVPLNQLDKEICAHLSEPVDPIKYAFGWFDPIGFRLACGKSFADIRQELIKSKDEHTAHCLTDSEDMRYMVAEAWASLLAICDLLDEHFTPDSWVEIGKR